MTSTSSNSVSRSVVQLGTKCGAMRQRALLLSNEFKFLANSYLLANGTMLILLYMYIACT